jgi:hypothetical protein
LIANWIAVGDQSISYDFSVSVTALPPATAIPGALVGYSGAPFPSTFVPPNQAGTGPYTYSDSNGYVITGGNLFTDLNCNSCIGAGGGAEFSDPTPPQSMTLTFTQLFSAGTGGLVVQEQQFAGIQQTRAGK